MGFLDKAEAAAQQAEAKLNSVTANANQSQQGQVADTWLKELGQWAYADRMGRDPRAAAEVNVRVQQLQQWEQHNGALVPLPLASLAAAPTAPAPASIPGTFSPPGDARPTPVPAGPSATIPQPAVPTPGPSLGPMAPPGPGEPLTPAPLAAAPTEAAPPAPPLAPLDAEPPTAPIPPTELPSPSGPPRGTPSAPA